MSKLVCSGDRREINLSHRSILNNLLAFSALKEHYASFLKCGCASWLPSRERNMGIKKKKGELPAAEN